MTEVYEWGPDDGEEHQPVRISTRVADMLVPAIPGAVIRKCGRCNEPVYFSPDQEIPDAVKDAELVCSRCLLDSEDTGPYIPEDVAGVLRAQHAIADRLLRSRN